MRYKMKSLKIINMKNIWYDRLLHLLAGIAIGYLIFNTL